MGINLIVRSTCICISMHMHTEHGNIDMEIEHVHVHMHAHAHGTWEHGYGDGHLRTKSRILFLKVDRVASIGAVVIVLTKRRT